MLLAGVMPEVEYEDLVADTEQQARRIVEYCGLAWDAACLDFYTTRRPVLTASAMQVRQPIYRSSVGWSRAYAPLLESAGPRIGRRGISAHRWCRTVCHDKIVTAVRRAAMFNETVTIAVAFECGATGGAGIFDTDRRARLPLGVPAFFRVAAAKQ